MIFASIQIKVPARYRKPRKTICVWGAGRHAAPQFEPTDAACHGVARLVPDRVARLGLRTPGPSRKDSLKAPRCPPGAAGIDVIGPVRAQAEPRRADSGRGPRPGCSRGAGRPSRAGLGDESIRQEVDLGAESAPDATARGIRRLFLGAHVRTADRSGSARVGAIRRGQTPRSH